MDGQLRQELDAARALLEEDPAAALERARKLAVRGPASAASHRLMAAALRRMGRHSEADSAERRSIEASLRLPNLDEAARAINAGRIQQAERLVRLYLDEDPEDPEALRLLAEIAARAGFVREAEAFLRNLLTAAPTFVRAYVNLASLLHPLGRSDEAIAFLDLALEREPQHSIVLSFKGAMLISQRRLREALEVHEQLLRVAPEQAPTWMNYGHVLKTVGRADEAVAAYRKALELAPNSGFAWWGLANIRTMRFDEQDIAAMRQALKGSPADLDKVQLHFALGRALGDQADFEGSFGHFAEGNALRTVLLPYDPGRIEADVRKAEALFTPAFLHARAGVGCDAADPIFILGMPRSGSTLVEQILASHPLVEGADELPELSRIAERIAGPQSSGSSWLDRIAALGTDELRSLGETYLSAVRAYRTTDRPFFTDKMPQNWQLVGLIRLILPNARIVDVRRHPLACCFSNFALYFNSRTNFGSRLEDLGLQYRAYVRMMAHFDEVEPGRIYRLLYERLIDDPERQVHSLLDWLGLPFEQSCLRFYENKRPVHTPSAEQVRQPIDRSRMDHWRNYERWLEPLKSALGDVLHADRPGRDGLPG